MELRNFVDTIVNYTLFCRSKLDCCGFFRNIFYLRSNAQTTPTIDFFHFVI